MQLGVRGEVAFGGSQEAFPLEAPRATFNAMAVDFLPLESLIVPIHRPLDCFVLCENLVFFLLYG